MPNPLNLLFGKCFFSCSDKEVVCGGANPHSIFLCLCDTKHGMPSPGHSEWGNGPWLGPCPRLIQSFLDLVFLTGAEGGRALFHLWLLRTWSYLGARTHSPEKTRREKMQTVQRKMQDAETAFSCSRPSANHTPNLSNFV